MGSCQYRFNLTEIYQKTKPGMGVETHCGGRTYAAVDEPEMLPMTIRDDNGDAHTEYVHTGSYLPREVDDPHCPAHGGTPEPPPRIKTTAELISAGQALEAARQEYLAELERAGLPLDVPANQLALERSEADASHAVQ